MREGGGETVRSWRLAWPRSRAYGVVRAGLWRGEGGSRAYGVVRTGRMVGERAHIAWWRSDASLVPSLPRQQIVSLVYVVTCVM